MNTLIALFSWSGNTERIAREIAQKTGGDLFRIERETPYSSDYNTCAYTEAKEEADKHLRPAIQKPLPDISGYDTIIVAFPIWWYTLPMPVMTFLESYPDWNRKRMYIFANSYSDIPSQFVNSVRDAMTSARGADVRPGLYNKDIDSLDRWLKENRLTEKKETQCASGI